MRHLDWLALVVVHARFTGRRDLKPSAHHYVGTICGLGLLLVLSFAPRGLSPGTPVFPCP